MKKVALITGITGQDGSYLAQLLLAKDYEVHGTTRKAAETALGLTHLNLTNSVTLHTCALEELTPVENLLTIIKPTEIYHLAAQSSISDSLKNPITTVNFNSTSTLNLLETLRKHNLTTKLFHASSSEIFDPEASSPLSSHSPIKPIHPYGVSKAAAHFLVQTYRNTYGLYAVNGILFPHESPLRDRNTIIKMFVAQAKAIQAGTATDFFLAYPDNLRDIGDAESYVQAMWHSLQSPVADDYIICSGDIISIRSIAETILAKYGLDTSCLKIDNTLVREPNIPVIFGDAKETEKKLGWRNQTSLFETIDKIIELEDRTPI